MNTWGRASVVAAMVVAGAAAAAEDHTGGPVAVYWMSAQTSSGFMAGLMGAGGKPDRGAMMSMMMHGGPDPNAVSHTLRLQLGSTHRPNSSPSAEHDPSEALNTGPLPLVTPVAQPSQPVEEEPRAPEQYQRPQGRILIFWGCGEHAGPNQPYVIDFAQMQNNPQAMAGLMHSMAAASMQPPSPGRFATYGEWPNDQSRTAIPPDGSLVGDHTVKGDYSPDIHFSLGPDQDFMAPLRLITNVRTPSGAVQLAWTPAPTALGYFATAMGGGGGGQGGGVTAVMWTSSASQAFAFGLPDYLAPSETRRLVADGHLLAPSQTQCAVPQEAVQAMGRGGIVQLAGYGEEANFAWPARPQRPIWMVKVRYRTTTSGMLGQANLMGGRRGADDDDNNGGQQQQQHGGFMHGLGGLGGFIP